MSSATPTEINKLVPPKNEAKLEVIPNRTMNAGRIAMIAKKIERKILLKKVNPVKTTEIGKLVLQELKRVDKMAYVRFASVYRQFKDRQDFVRELEQLAN